MRTKRREASIFKNRGRGKFRIRPVGRGGWSLTALCKLLCTCFIAYGKREEIKAGQRQKVRSWQLFCPLCSASSRLSAPTARPEPVRPPNRPQGTFAFHPLKRQSRPPPHTKTHARTHKLGMHSHPTENICCTSQQAHQPDATLGFAGPRRTSCL